MFRLHFIYISVFNLLNWLLCPYPVFPASMIQWYVIKCMNKTNKYPKVGWCQTYIPPPPPPPPPPKKKKKKNTKKNTYTIVRSAKLVVSALWLHGSSWVKFPISGHYFATGIYVFQGIWAVCVIYALANMNIRWHWNKIYTVGWVYSAPWYIIVYLYISYCCIYIDRQSTHHKRFWTFTGKSNYKTFSLKDNPCNVQWNVIKNAQNRPGSLLFVIVPLSEMNVDSCSLPMQLVALKTWHWLCF